MNGASCSTKGDKDRDNAAPYTKTRCLQPWLLDRPAHTTQPRISRATNHQILCALDALKLTEVVLKPANTHYACGVGNTDGMLKVESRWLAAGWS